MPYWELFYHVVWATKKRAALITADVEPIIHQLLRTKAIGLGGRLFALNGTTDHVHMVVAIPPKIAVSRFVGQVKGVASRRLNESKVTTEVFGWQHEYAAFSFDRKRLPNYVAYVRGQKQHHAGGTVIPVLERIVDNGVRSVSGLTPAYGVEEEVWRRELEGRSSRVDRAGGLAGDES